MNPQIAEPVIIQGPSGGAPRVAIVGCGGAGCNILAEGKIPRPGARIAIGSEPNAMRSLIVDKKVLAEPWVLERDASVSPKLSRVAVGDTERDIADSLGDADICFILAGLGGLSGGWGAVLGARAANLARSTCLCVASAPFSAEGSSRRDRATAQLGALLQVADGVLVVPNDMILSVAPKIPLNRAFSVMNSVLASPVNLMLESLGRDEIGLLKAHLAGGKLLAMDSAEWDRENAEFAVIEQLNKSRWLDMASRKPASAILLVEGRSLYDDLQELGKLFSRAAGAGCRVMVANSGNRSKGLRVTAVVGF